MTEGMLVIGRSERMGLGAMTQDFCEAFKPKHLITMDRGRAQLFDPFKVAKMVYQCKTYPSQLAIPKIHTLVGFETYYDDALLEQCNKAGVKTVLFPMWEWTPVRHAATSKHLITLSATDASYYRLGNSVSMRWPASPACRPLIENERMTDPGEAVIDGGFPIGYDRRSMRVLNWPPKTFVHIAGNAQHNRDGTREVLQAAECLKGTDSRLVVYSAFGADQWEHDRSAPIEFRQAAASRRELFDGCDCLVQPRRLGGHSLPIDEAVGEGIPVITLSGDDWDTRASFTVASIEQPPERFGRVVAPVRRARIDSLGTLLSELSRGKHERPAPKSLPTWDDFKADWATKIG